MAIKIDELRNAEFVDEWENGFGWIARPDEKMRRTCHAFVDEGGVHLVDPLDAENLDEKISEFGEVEGIVILFERHERDAVELAERYECPVYVPEWFERELDAELEEISGSVPGTDWEIHTVVDSRLSKEAALYNRENRSLIVADSLGTAEHLRGRGEKLGMSPLYRFSPPEKLLDFEPERIFCGHGRGITENAAELLKETISNGRRKTPSAYFNAFYKMLKRS
ncbi:MAG: hypothetical protein ABEJ03_00070 [Candidatus Nanohaloarchaea archaeon]